ncbi:hypothetical protein NDU88_003298 [Pleurodeles waltl]|uniref:UPAR/Ly6 domain-containing protein n=1 Tax=Pleurodeles waltl TaxID=8319 RepID=A0AAV7MS16_PLEWA|nr:hypothetical protein NDU88_003298 [Pleurodeles waltl]
MRTLLFLCLIFSVVSGGSTLVCKACSGYKGCIGVKSFCLPSEKSCAIFRTWATLGKVSTPSFVRTCFKGPSTCNTLYSVSAGKFRVTSYSKCCSANLCNTGSLNWPPMNTTVNGLQCPSCYTRNAASCNANTTIDCRGGENRCIRFAGIVKTDSGSFQTSFRGCATQSTCRAGVEALYPDASVKQGTLRVLLRQLEDQLRDLEKHYCVSADVSLLAEARAHHDQYDDAARREVCYLGKATGLAKCLLISCAHSAPVNILFHYSTSRPA